MVVALLVLAQSGFVHSPYSAYDIQKLRGFEVRISPAALNNPSTKPALQLLDHKLKFIEKTVPKDALKTLRTIKFFIENNNPGFPCACYHVSKDWLVPNGYIAEKVNSVEIANPANFVKWSQDQPWMVLHELAHGYHFLKFGYEDKQIQACLDSAKSAGIYDLVQRYNGRYERHYALTNQQEYFAECTEAYFGKNDYFPFVRAELKSTDPKGFELVRAKWGIE